MAGGLIRRPDLVFMTPAEATELRRLRERSEITFWRVAFCEECGAETMKTKRFCSQRCYDGWRKKQLKDEDGDDGEEELGEVD